MNSVKRILVPVLILSLIGLFLPETLLAGQSRLYVQNTSAKGITEHSPEILSTPEEDIPVEKVKKKGMSKWVWIGLGVLLVGGAAAAGGGGGGGDDGGSAPPPDTGDVTIQW